MPQYFHFQLRKSDGRIIIVHANVVPVTAPEKLMAVVLAPLHKVWLAVDNNGWSWINRDVKVCVMFQDKLLADGVTVMVAVTGVTFCIDGSKGCNISITRCGKTNGSCIG
jgi:hypothetical protein